MSVIISKVEDLVAKLSFTDGSTYTGEIHLGDQGEITIDGRGVKTLANGDKCTGTFYDGKIEGSCRIDYPNHDVYCGDVVEGKAFGEGTLSTPEGFHYKGIFGPQGFMSGRRSGPSPGDDIFEGTFKYEEGNPHPVPLEGEFKKAPKAKMPVGGIKRKSEDPAHG